MSSRQTSILTFLATALLVLHAPRAAGQAAPLCNRWLPFVVDNVAVRVPYCGNVDLTGSQLGARQAVIVIHGTNRNAAEYASWIADAAARAGAVTLIVAPQFPTAEELDAYGLGSDVLYWSTGGWKEGSRSLNEPAHPRAVRASSFAVAEEFVRALVAVAPSLESIVFVGHSAGAQFVQRFAAGNSVDGTASGVELRYVVANPGSYLYLDPVRVEDPVAGTFSVPSGTGCDSWFHDYKYGTDELNTYMDAVGRIGLVARYLSRDVTTLLGEEDDDPADPYLDTTCAAQLQGPHRLGRGAIYASYVESHLGSAVTGSHRFHLVYGVGHSPSQMFDSDCGLSAIFGRADLVGACGEVGAVLVTAPAPPSPSKGLSIESVAPNPFNPATEVRFRGRVDARITVRVYDMRGHRVASLFDGWATGELQSVTWRADDVASGTYIVRVESEGGVAAKKVAVLK